MQDTKTLANETDSMPTTVAVESKPQPTKHLVLVSRPSYMGIYVAVDADNTAEAVAKLKQRVESDDTINHSLSELFEEMWLTADRAVQADQGGFIFSAAHHHYRVDGRFNLELNMSHVISPPTFSNSSSTTAGLRWQQSI